MTSVMPDVIRTVYGNERARIRRSYWSTDHGPRVKVHVGDIVHSVTYDPDKLASTNHQDAAEVVLRDMFPGIVFTLTRVGGWTPQNPDRGDYAVFVTRVTGG